MRTLKKIPNHIQTLIQTIEMAASELRSYDYVLIGTEPAYGMVDVSGFLIFDSEKDEYREEEAVATITMR